jgi:hypothetical protein
MAVRGCAKPFRIGPAAAQCPFFSSGSLTRCGALAARAAPRPLRWQEQPREDGPVATSRQEYRPVIEPRSAAERSPEEVAREQALHEVEQTLLNIEQAIRRADCGRRAISPDGNERNLRLALDRAVEQLEAIRKELFQSGYFGGQQQRLI